MAQKKALKMKKKRSNGKWFVNRSNQTGPPLCGVASNFDDYHKIGYIKCQILLDAAAAAATTACTHQPAIRHLHSSHSQFFTLVLSLSLALISTSTYNAIHSFQMDYN